ncbi:MAG: hypothetical protein CMB26_04015 [Euryarchaeota archaeon]|nr:hypothetical protein [Euryarchaeota archaeon]DAC60709.1 MAG TPA: archease [Candidatus Poseidoniales archaeon]HIH82281.1 archease [Candidatus Thalassarchaeaceae archaeon]|tara:strand:+ start:10473 stop:10943 length:471 start_codon:yes stop_codon:yes gene_type:complete
MSWWVLPTTADIGIVCFAQSSSRLFEEAASGLQHILLSDAAIKSVETHLRHTSQWSIEATEGREDLTLVRWLEEVLYKCEVERQFLVDCQIKIDEELLAQVSWVNADTIEREIEVKAVTRHELQCRSVAQGEIIAGRGDVPDFEGPGWYCRVIFDI